MGLLLHAITSRPEGSAPRGLRGAALLVRHVGELTVWATPLPDEAAPFTKEDVLEHHRIVSEVFAVVRACLPVRFPTQVEDVALDAEALLPRLERVRDACELAVTAVWRPPFQESTPPVTATTPGRRYLQQRQIAVHRHDQAEQLADDILKVVGPSVLDESHSVRPSEKIALSLALLVPRDAVERVRGRVPRSAQDVRILVSGPWPAYTFAAAGFEHTYGRGTGSTQA